MLCAWVVMLAHRYLSARLVCRGCREAQVIFPSAVGTRISLPYIYVALCQEGFCAQGFGTVPHVQTFQLGR